MGEKATKAMMHGSQGSNDELPELLIGELEVIRERDGLITPPAVVESARPDSSPLHHHFEWDDTEAAHSFRLSQARGLIRRFEVEVTIATGTVKLPVYSNVRITQPSGQVVQGYARTHDILKDPVRKEALLRSVRDAARRLLEQAKNLDEASNLRDALEQFVEKNDRL